MQAVIVIGICRTAPELQLKRREISIRWIRTERIADVESVDDPKRGLHGYRRGKIYGDIVGRGRNVRGENRRIIGVVAVGSHGKIEYVSNFQVERDRVIDAYSIGTGNELVVN